MIEKLDSLNVSKGRKKQAYFAKAGLYLTLAMY